MFGVLFILRIFVNHIIGDKYACNIGSCADFICTDNHMYAHHGQKAARRIAADRACNNHTSF